MIICAISCSISASSATTCMVMVVAMPKVFEQIGDDLVLRARTEAAALGHLYDLYYERIFRFCVHRLFRREIAEDVTSTIFLEVARKISTFAGRTRRDFRNWLYAIAANQVNAYLRKTLRRRKLLTAATASKRSAGNDSPKILSELDWPVLYQAILKLKPEHQTIVTLRFFESMGFDQIGQIVHARPATVRVTLHRILRKLRKHLQTVLNGEE